MAAVYFNSDLYMCFLDIPSICQFKGKQNPAIKTVEKEGAVFEEKGDPAAGTRLRKVLRQIKVAATEKENTVK